MKYNEALGYVLELAEQELKHKFGHAVLEGSQKEIQKYRDRREALDTLNKKPTAEFKDELRQFLIENQISAWDVVQEVPGALSVIADHYSNQVQERMGLICQQD